jgi:uncharacterized protein (TIGR00645 family)
MYASRWILAPVYLGLSIAIFVLGLKFFTVLVRVVPTIFSMSESDLVLTILSLVDMTLVGGLLIMVMFTGYENFVTKMELNSESDGLGWLSKMDANAVKNKVSASIVAISAIHLLQIFMNAENTPNEKIYCYILLHLTFVLSAFTMGHLDLIMKKHET